MFFILFILLSGSGDTKVCLWTKFHAATEAIQGYFSRSLATGYSSTYHISEIWTAVPGKTRLVNKNENTRYTRYYCCPYQRRDRSSKALVRENDLVHAELKQSYLYEYDTSIEFDQPRDPPRPPPLCSTQHENTRSQ